MQFIKQSFTNANIKISQLVFKQLQITPLDVVYDGEVIQIYETLPIVEYSDIPIPNNQSEVVFRGYWLSLLIKNGVCIGHAISTPIGPGEQEWRLEGVFSGDMSRMIGDGLKAFRKDHPEKEVCLLFIPSYHSYALVSIEKDEGCVFWANAPYTNKNITGKEPLNLGEFSEIISSQAPICDFGCNIMEQTSSNTSFTFEQIRSDLIWGIGYLLIIQTLILLLLKKLSFL